MQRPAPINPNAPVTHSASAASLPQTLCHTCAPQQALAYPLLHPQMLIHTFIHTSIHQYRYTNMYTHHLSRRHPPLRPPRPRSCSWPRATCAPAGAAPPPEAMKTRACVHARVKRAFACRCVRAQCTCSMRTCWRFSSTWTCQTATCARACFALSG